MARKKLLGIVSIAMSLCVLITSSVLLIKMSMSGKFIYAPQDCHHLQNASRTEYDTRASTPSPSAAMNKESRSKSKHKEVDTTSTKCPTSSTKKKSTAIRHTTTATPLAVTKKRTKTEPLHPLRQVGRKKRSVSNLQQQQQPQLEEKIRNEHQYFLILTISTIILSVVQMMSGVVSLCPRVQTSQTCVMLWAFLNTLLIIFFVIILGTSFYLAEFLKTTFKAEFWTFICVMFGDLLLLVLAVFILSRHRDRHVSSSEYKA